MDDGQISEQADVLMLFSVLSADELRSCSSAVHCAPARPGGEFRAGGSEPGVGDQGTGAARSAFLPIAATDTTRNRGISSTGSTWVTAPSRPIAAEGIP